MMQKNQNCRSTKFGGQADWCTRKPSEGLISYQDSKKKISMSQVSTDQKSQSIIESSKTKNCECECICIQQQLVMSKLAQLSVLIQQKNKKIQQLEQFITRISKMALMIDPHQSSQQSSNCALGNFKFLGIGSHKASLSQHSQQDPRVQSMNIQIQKLAKNKLRDHFGKQISNNLKGNVSILSQKSIQKWNRRKITDESSQIQESSQFEIRQPLAILNKGCSKSSLDSSFIKNRILKSHGKAISSVNEYQQSVQQLQSHTFYDATEAQIRIASLNQKNTLNAEKDYCLSNSGMKNQDGISRISSKHQFSNGQHPSFFTLPQSEINVEGIVKQLTSYQMNKFSR